jgi:sulfatase maturation enzyme AslB (radical SAM superfamily)
LQSNCTLITEANINEFSNYNNLSDILTSLDGPREVHDMIRGVPGTFDKLDKAMELIRQKMPNVPITVFATILINDNIDRFHELIDTAKSLGLGTINVLFEQVYSRAEIEQTKSKFKLWGWEAGIDYRLNTQERNPIFSEHLDVIELQKKMADIREYGLKKDCFVNFTPFNFYRNLNQYLGKEKIKKIFCLKLLEPELRISQKGDVVWCDIIEKSFGNLLEKNPDEIWLSKEYQDFRKYLSQRSLPTCSRCCKAFYYK